MKDESRPLPVPPSVNGGVGKTVPETGRARAQEDSTVKSGSGRQGADSGNMKSREARQPKEEEGRPPPTPTRRTPGSGFQAGRKSVPDGNSDTKGNRGVKVEDREQLTEEKRPAVSNVTQIKTDRQANERDRSRDRGGEREREHKARRQEVRRAVGDSNTEERESGRTGDTLKRKKHARDANADSDDDYDYNPPSTSTSQPAAQKRRKMEEGTAISVRSGRERDMKKEERATGLSKKPDVASSSGKTGPRDREREIARGRDGERQVKREIPPTRIDRTAKEQKEGVNASASARIKRDSSPLPKHSKSSSAMDSRIKKELREQNMKELSPHPTSRKKEPSPLPPSTYTRNVSTSSSRPSGRSRRRSPIYTSSDEDDRPHPSTSAVKREKLPPTPPVTSSRTQAHPTARPEQVKSEMRNDRETKGKAKGHVDKAHPTTRPLPTSHAALRARYSSSYAEYITAFSDVVRQRSRIETLLANSHSNSHSHSNSEVEEGDGEEGIMSEEGLVGLIEECDKWKGDLEKIRGVWGGNEVHGTGAGGVVKVEG